jgi:hypothetical protein
MAGFPSPQVRPTRERPCGGGAEAARRVDEANKLLKEVANMLTGMRRTMLGGSNRSQ